MSPGILASVITATAAFIGVMVGGWLTALNQKRERRHRRISEQLAGFCGPILAIRAQVLSQRELGQRISGAAEAAWQAMVKRAYEGNDELGKLDRMEKLTQQRWPSFEKLTEYGNRQLVEEVIPSYRKMVELFTSKMHLAEPSTITYFPALLEFVEIWNRWLNESLPGEVLGILNHTEDTLFPLYDNLLENFTRMHQELAEKRRWWGWWRRSPIKVHGPALAVNPFAAPKRDS
jgi:hypothetical protein